MLRTRTEQEIGEYGTCVSTKGIAYSTEATAYNNRGTIEDYVLPGNGHDLTISKHYYRGKFPTISGTWGYDRRAFSASNLPIGAIWDPEYGISHLTVGGIPTLAAAAAEIAAQTNPSRPLVDLPVFAKELQDLPGLLLKRTNDIGRDISRGRLSNEFGWKPLVGDLVKLLSFKKEMQARVNELEHLYKSGLRRKRIVMSGSVTGDGQITVGHSLRSLHQTNVVYTSTARTTTVKVTGFVRWKPDLAPPRFLGLVDGSVHDKAFRALIGANPAILDASSIWEMIPFSWLADWCSNAGDYLAAHRNIVGAHIDEILVMYHYLTEQKLTFKATGEAYDQALVLSSNELTRYREHKTRSRAVLNVEAHMPFLNERKVMILSDIVRNNFR